MMVLFGLGGGQSKFFVVVRKTVVEKKLTELPAVTTLVTEDKGGHRFIS